MRGLRIGYPRGYRISAGQSAYSLSGKDAALSTGSDLVADGVTGKIAPGELVAFASDGVHGFGDVGPDRIFWDPCTNYDIPGNPIRSSDPEVGTYDSSQIEQIVRTGGRGASGKCALITHITQTERISTGGARTNRIKFGANYSRFYFYRSWKWFQQPTSVSGSFCKMAWIFQGDNGFDGSELDLVLVSFNGGPNSAAFASNDGSDTWTIPSFGMTDNVVTDGTAWNDIESLVNINPTKGLVDIRQQLWTSTKTNYDSGLVTSSPTSVTNSTDVRTANQMTVPGWFGDSGGDTRLQGPLEVGQCDPCLQVGAGAFARVQAGNASTRAGCTGITPPFEIISWSNDLIEAVLYPAGFPSFAGTSIYIYDANGLIVPYNASNTRLIH